MDAVRVVYHAEDESWWAESADVAGWTAVADSLGALRALVRESLREFCGDDVAIKELSVPLTSGSGSS